MAGGQTESFQNVRGAKVYTISLHTAQTPHSVLHTENVAGRGKLSFQNVRGAMAGG